MNQESQLNHLLAAAIGVSQGDYDDRITEVLVLIGQGLFLDEIYHNKVLDLAIEIQEVFKKESALHKGCLGISPHEEAKTNPE